MWEVASRSLFIYFPLSSSSSVDPCQACAPRLALDLGSSRQGVTIITGMRIMEKIQTALFCFCVWCVATVDVQQLLVPTCFVVVVVLFIFRLVGVGRSELL